MTIRARRLVIELDAEIVSDDWTDRDLVDNSVDYLQVIISRAEGDRTTNPEPAAYNLLVDDITVWTREDYTADLEELAAQPLRPPYGTLVGDRHEPIPLDDPRVENGTRAVHLRARMGVIRRELWALQQEYDAIPRMCK